MYTFLTWIHRGGRSRTGKLLAPKLGILKYVVDGLQNGRTDDVLICPISLQYDKVRHSADVCY